MILKQLNPKQYEAVVQTEGPMLILAGAGSGKTKVLTTKIAYLILEQQVRSGEILAITFTNKAAAEMKERVATLLNRDVSAMWIGTFHSVCVRILRKGAEVIGYEKNFSIYDRDDQKTLLKEIYKALDINEKMFKYNAVIAKISTAKNEGISPRAFASIHLDNFADETVAAIYSEYEDRKEKYNAFDFDDLILKALEILKKDAKLLSEYQERFRYLFVDEYQDTNASQYELIKLLAAKHQNICVVGDADQSIYGWRGADIRNILNFEKDFNQAKTVILEENYRSTKSILDAANTVIKNNVKRKEKNLWTSNDAGKKPTYLEVDSEDGEGRAVVEWINHLIYNGYKLTDMAILYRTNALSRQFEEALMFSSIPYRIVGGLKFYDRKEIKDILAYLRVIVNPNDNVSLKRIINYPKRGIGATSLDRIEKIAQDNEMSIYDVITDEELVTKVSGGAGRGLQAFTEMIYEVLRKEPTLSLTGIVNFVIEKSGIVGDLRKEERVEAQTRLENIEAFISAVAAFAEQNPDANLEDYLASVSLMSEVDKTEDKESGISLMTIHASKGLEYKVIFLCGLEEGLFPSARSMEEDGLEEERRLFYVAVTRAKEELYITSTTQRRTYGQLKAAVGSRFIEEMEDYVERNKQRGSYKGNSIRGDEDHYTGAKSLNDLREKMKFNLEKRKEEIEKKKNTKFSTGDRIRHKKFGEGMIISVSPKEGGDEVVISFENKGIKKLNLDLAPIERIR